MSPLKTVKSLLRALKMGLYKFSKKTKQAPIYVFILTNL